MLSTTSKPAWHPNTQALYDKLMDFQFDMQATDFTFLQRVAQENAWSANYAERVLLEYRRFLLLTRMGEGEISPSDAVDQVWHLHMVYTHSYWDELCGKVLQYPLHHNPIDGGGKDRETFMAQYARTLVRYREVFGEEPPADIWPSVETRFASHTLPHFQRVDMNLYKPKPVVSGWVKWLVLGSIFAGVTAVANVFFAVLAVLFVNFLFFSDVMASGGGCGGGGCGGGGCGGGCGGGGCGGCGG